VSSRPARWACLDRQIQVQLTGKLLSSSIGNSRAAQPQPGPCRVHWRELRDISGGKNCETIRNSGSPVRFAADCCSTACGATTRAPTARPAATGRSAPDDSDHHEQLDEREAARASKVVDRCKLNPPPGREITIRSISKIAHRLQQHTRPRRVGVATVATIVGQMCENRNQILTNRCGHAGWGRIAGRGVCGGQTATVLA